MNAFIQKNKKLLKFYYIALRLSGWILLTLGVCSYAIIIVLGRTLRVEAIVATSINIRLGGSHLILFGLLGLGIAQLIKYLYDSKSKAGFILRHGNKFLYLYVIAILILMVIRNVYTIKYLSSIDIEHEQLLYCSTTITSIVLFAAKGLVLIGVGQFLRRILPIIEESRTLV